MIHFFADQSTVCAYNHAGHDGECIPHPDNARILREMGLDPESKHRVKDALDLTNGESLPYDEFVTPILERLKADKLLVPVSRGQAIYGPGMLITAARLAHELRQAYEAGYMEGLSQ